MRCSTRSRARAWAGALLAFALCLAPAAHAKKGSSARAKAKAKVLFKQAQHAYGLGQFQAALGKYTEAYELAPFPEFLFNIAQCHRQLGEYERAAFFYRRYLTHPAGAAPKNEALARKLLDQAERDQALARETELEKARADAARAQADALKAQLEPRLAGGGPLDPLPGAEVAPPLWGRWWVWAGVGVVAAGVTTYVVASKGRAPAATTLGDIRF